MFKNLIILGLLSITLITGCKTSSTAQVDKAIKDFGSLLGGNDELTTDDVAKGLKEALMQGIGSASDQASMVDGYLKNNLIRIAFPPDAEKVESRLRQIGLGPEVDKFITSLNRGAEKAAKEAKPIFLEAIRNLTLEDAWGILKGDENSATDYLKRTTSSSLTEKFQPIISDALEEVNATKYYDDLVTSYNKIPFVSKVNPDLDQYATEQAIDGLFVLIAEEEAEIRRNPAARTTRLMQKVFGN
ncbi:MAG: hypothetical protein DHS20C17_27060 [Cyclobacteriaceae bacterium]|nr:MAG: hypothetical protein DHS20C17_27060 [Cyclobacteriaceae bacterium]